MTKPPEIKDELDRMRAEYEPLLPIEKKLVAWSLGLGLSLLAILYLINRFFPPAGH